MLLQCCQLTKTQASLFCETVQDIDSCFLPYLHKNWDDRLAIVTDFYVFQSFSQTATQSFRFSRFCSRRVYKGETITYGLFSLLRLSVSLYDHNNQRQTWLKKDVGLSAK